MLFVSFTKGPGGFPCVLIITVSVSTLMPIDGITLVDHRVFVLGGDQEVLDGAAIFEVSLDAISTTDLFDAFTKTLCVGYDDVAYFLQHINSVDPAIKIAVEDNKEDGSIPFLDTIVKPEADGGLSAHSFGPMGEGVNDTKLG